MALRQFVQELGLRLRRDDVRDLVDEPRPVPQPEQSRDERLRVECLELVDVLAGADEDDGRSRGGRRARCAPPPFAWPSSFVMMTLPTSTVALNASPGPARLGRWKSPSRRWSCPA